MGFMTNYVYLIYKKSNTGKDNTCKQRIIM